MTPETIRFVTDGGADAPTKEAEKYKVTVVSLEVNIYDNKSKETRVLDVNEDLLPIMVADPDLKPKTSAPSGGAFLKAYEDIPEKEIISVHIFSSKSATYKNAEWAADQINNSPETYGEKHVTVYDSQTASIATWALVRRGFLSPKTDVTKIVEDIEDARKRLTFYAILQDPKYAAQKDDNFTQDIAKVLASKLKIKPTITVIDNKFHVVHQGLSKNNMVTDLIKKINNSGPLEEIGIGHFGAIDAARRAQDELSQTHSFEIPIYDIKQLISAYGGPGAIGIYTIKKKVA